MREMSREERWGSTDYAEKGDEEDNDVTGMNLNEHSSHSHILLGSKKCLNVQWREREKKEKYYSNK